MTSTAQLPAPTWFVGCGNMGQAIVEGWRTAGIDLSQVIVIRPSGTPVEGVRTVRSLAVVARPKLAKSCVPISSRAARSIAPSSRGCGSCSANRRQRGARPESFHPPHFGGVWSQ